MRRVALLAMAALWVAAAQAQELGTPAAPEGLLILDQERLFSDSLYGARVDAELDAASQVLATENREIEAELTAEELELTDARATLPREDFLALADEFNIRVEAIRAEQDAKARALNTAAELARQRFFDLVVPILLQIVQERNAAVILDRRVVLLAADTVDITDAAVAAVDAALGDGGPEPVLEIGPVAPEPRPGDAAIEAPGE